MAVSKKMTRPRFREWLATKAQKTKVGFRSGKTPVERFMEINHITGSDLPQWAQRHNELIRNHPQGRDSISAGAATRVLDSIK